MKVLITGSAGQLGRSLLDKLQDSTHTVEAHDIDTLDLRDTDQIALVFARFQPDVLINAAAYTAVDKAETDPEAAELLNHEVVNYLITECVAHNVRLIQVSTDFVFDGNQSTPYQPGDACAPLSVYGRTKRRAEEAIISNKCLNGLILRTAWLYSPYGNNFVKSMLRLMADKSELGIVYDQVGTPTSAASLTELISIALGRPELSGIYHWTDAGVASWYDFAIAIKEEATQMGLLDRDVSVLPIRSEQYPTPAARPAFSVLDKSATCRDFGVIPIHWRQRLREVLQVLPGDSI